MDAHLDFSFKHPRSSLWSAQSGYPSHCPVAGTHSPSAHKKLPGALQRHEEFPPGDIWQSTEPEPSRKYQIHILIRCRCSRLERSFLAECPGLELREAA